MKLLRALAVLFAVCLAISVMTLSASAKTAASGTCGADGDNLTWVLDDKGTLTVSGEGDMRSFLYTNEDKEWYSRRSEIKTVIIEEGVTSIGQFAFDGCKAITRVEIPDSVVRVEYGAFRECTGLQSVTVPAGIKSFGRDVFASCEKLQSVTLSEGLQKIGSGMFHGCTSLKTVHIPSTVKSIGSFAFSETGLTGITIPASVKEIASYAFSGCGKLKTIAFRGDAPKMESTVFDSTPDGGSVQAIAYYPEGNDTWNEKTMKQYRGSITWKAAQALKITAQPKTVYAQSGKAAKSVVSAVGDGLTYTWYVKDAGASSYVKASATGSTYNVTMTNARKDRRVYCVVRDVWGEEIKSKTVLLRMAAKITTQPKSVTVKPGETAKVTVKAVGDGLSYTWYFKNAGAAKFIKSSAAGTEYSAEMKAACDGRQIYCVVKDKYGKTAKTDTATLRMYTPVKITAQPKSAYVQRGKTALVTVKATGYGLSYQWYVKSVGSTAYKKSSVTGDTYSVKMTDAVRDRMIYCIVTDMFGEKVKTKTVSLRMAASIITQPTHAGAKLGEKAKTTVKAAGDGLTYTWYIKNQGASKFTKSSIKSAAYTVKLSEKTDGRQAYCVVKDKYGKSVKTKTVTFGTPVKIATQPKTTYAKWKKTAKVSVKAEGDGLTYTWYEKDKGETKYKKSSQTASTYKTTMNDDSRDRMVYCVVKDRYGYSVKTKTVSLRLAVTITDSPYDAWEGEGSTVTVRVWAMGDGLTYTWYYKDRDDNSFKKITSATGREYQFEMTKESDGRQFYCVVKDKYGNTAKSEVAQVVIIYGPL